MPSHPSDLQSWTTSPDEPYEIACDESGFAGGNLVGPGHSPVFVHASVHLDPAVAASVIREVRQSIGAKGGEYKSAELMRPRHRDVLRWLLDPGGSVANAARVHLIDTRLFVLARLVDVLLGSRSVIGSQLPGRDPRSRELALTLYDSGAEAYGAQRWQDFLISGANLLRTNSRWLPKRPVDVFYEAVDALADGPSSHGVSEVIVLLQRTRPAAEAIRQAHLTDRTRSPLMEPLIPAVLRTVELWGAAAPSITLIHDEQSALTPARIAEISREFSTGHPGHRLAGIQRVDSRDDPRIQVADFLAGIAARYARALLEGRPDPELSPLINPLVDPGSLWSEPVGVGSESHVGDLVPARPSRPADASEVEDHIVLRT